MRTFEHPHHRRIGQVLASLDAARLRECACWFGGGTAIALRQGEYRESVDMDFMVSEQAGYRDLRHRLMAAGNLAPITRAGCAPIALEREIRADRYGIRMFVLVEKVPIKFEIVNEGRIQFDVPGRADKVCGVYTLSRTDLAASKFLANADRWPDDSVFSRDVIDLAMLDMPPRQLAPALRKAWEAYGATVVTDMRRALDTLRDRPGRLERCIKALSIALPPAAVQQRLRSLARRLTTLTSDGMEKMS
ncbi:MAG TPA: nucleotidyl transferase AbiEii/AbiGii toxin family protein [Oleiagrimonas sp.]|nr:nucleotidyl transferase AbiEii/AbiGii toxin family protein [Oleiagrimonas sp.]